jgi:hypothetical protein
MNTTQKNLKGDKNAWVIAATRDGGSKGYRLIGTAEVKDKQLIFAPAKEEATALTFKDRGPPHLHKTPALFKEPAMFSCNPEGSR